MESQSNFRTVSNPPRFTEFKPVLILAPIGRTAEVAHSTLQAAKLPSVIYADGADLVRGLGDEMGSEVGALLLIEEALTTSTAHRLSQFLTSQPVWSDLPIVIFTAEEPTHTSLQHLVSKIGGAAQRDAVTASGARGHAGLRDALRVDRPHASV